MARRKNLGSSERAPLAKQFVGYKKCEPWTNNMKLCVEGNTHGFTVNLVAGRNKLPVSVGDARTPTEAFANAKKFLTTKIYKGNN